MTGKMDDNQAKMDADRKTYQHIVARMEADRKTDKEQMLAVIKANQARMDANMGSMQAELKSAIKNERLNAIHAVRIRWDHPTQNRESYDER
jgi:hypothetical protein